MIGKIIFVWIIIVKEMTMVMDNIYGQHKIYEWEKYEYIKNLTTNLKENSKKNRI